MRILGIVALGVALSGCASSSSEIAPAYVSPVIYQSYTCQQLALEAQAISTRAATLSGVQDSQHSKDGWTTGRLQRGWSSAGRPHSLSAVISKRRLSSLR